MAMRFSVGKKLAVGFCSVVTLMVVVGFFGVRGLTRATDAGNEYERISKNSNLASDIDGSLLRQRMKLKDYLLEGDPKDMEQYDEAAKETDSLIATAETSFKSAERSAMVKRLVGMRDEYKSAIAGVKGYMTAQHQQLDGVLNIKGPEAALLIEKLSKDFKSEVDNLYELMDISEHFLSARIDAQKLLSSLDRTFADQGLAELDEALGQLREFKSTERKSDISTLINLFDDYKRGLSALSDAVLKRDELVKGTLNRIGPEMSKLLFDINASVVATQTKIGEELRASNNASMTWMIGAIIGACILAFGAAYVNTRLLTGPISQVGHILEAVAQGDLTQEAHVTSNDELGDMANQMAQALDQLNHVFIEIGRNVETLGTASEELTAVSQQMSANSEETSNQSNVVSAAAVQVSKNVETVATGVEEMGASIREIAQNAAEAARVAVSAVRAAESTNATVAKLGDSSVEIGNVIKVITSIAEQTNLLALNATIEAARAGEAGKGFAVVANEVKELAKETAKATEEIGQKIQVIQEDTREAISAITQISSIINQVNDISNTIASAVEEQSVTTNEIARNVAEASKGSSEIADNISSVASAAKDTSEGASSTQLAARQLAEMASELQQLVDRFQTRQASGAGRAVDGGRDSSARPQSRASVSRGTQAFHSAPGMH